MKQTFYLFCLLIAIQTTGHAVADNKAPQSNDLWGYTKEEAIEVCDPKGQRAYLSALVCPNGSRPDFCRVGNFGERTPIDIEGELTPEQEAQLVDRIMNKNAILASGEKDYHIVDGYEVTCGNDKHLIYMDMYHCQQPAPTHAPKGFTFSPDDDKPQAGRFKTPPAHPSIFSDFTFPL